ncbi:MAG: aminoglycoside 6'-N-acetyltransferase [Clostridia bacterium]|jgi:aminoglycoside 6'-N-acetyltransferase I|nr:GNAT family N-acetyltransferase [Clostridia bacterium]
MKIIKATENDLKSLIELENKLWKKHTIEELALETLNQIRDDKNAFFLAYDGVRAIGFSHISMRYEYVEGCNSSPTGYLEGIFVLKEYRRKQVASNLVVNCEEFAKQNGCLQFASDCEIKNIASIKFHRHVGFCIAKRNIHFKKDI